MLKLGGGNPLHPLDPELPISCTVINLLPCLSLENKTKIVTFRFKPSQLSELDAQAKAVNLTRSAYMTRKLTGQSVIPARVPAINWQLYGSLAEIAILLPAVGNNINQIAKTLNTAQKKGEPIPKFIPKPESLESSLELIKTIVEKLTEVRLALSGVKQSDDIEP